MFRFWHLERNSFSGLAFMVVMLLCTIALIFLNNNVIYKSDDSSHPTNIKSELTTSSGNHDELSRVKRLPGAIIIGSRKGGTRALLKFLEINPAVRAAHKEVHFFDKPQNYARGLDWYREQMPPSSLAEMTIEKSPAYFVTLGVPERVQAMNSSLKLILILRDPVIRLISDFSQLVANKIKAMEDEEDYDGKDYSSMIMADDRNQDIMGARNLSNSAWIKAKKDFKDYILRPDGGINDQRRSVRIGMYSIFLEKWISLFPINQIHFVDGEALIKNPYEELRQLELFLNLTPTIRPEHFVFNNKKGFYCLAQNSSRTTNLVDHPIKSEQTNVSGTLVQSNCLSRSKGRRHVDVNKELIDELRKFYAPYNEYLFSLTGKNFDWL